MSWTDAHRIAAIAAAHAHRDYGMDVAAPPIDVGAALAAADVPMLWRPMPRLFGAYLSGPGMRPGVLVNSAIPIGARRHTAAHELGHHCLRHTAAIDDGACLQLDPLDADSPASVIGRPRWTDPEKAAEAFAAWFLMPRPAVRAALDVLGLDLLQTATDVYRLSLILGTSYRSTIRHLPNLRLCSHTQANTWINQVPGRLKAGLDPAGTWDHRGSADLWSVDRGFDGTRIRLQPGDQLVAYLDRGLWVTLCGEPCLTACGSGPVGPGHPAESWTSWVATEATGDRDAHTSLTAVADARPHDVGAAGWSVDILVEAPPTGLDRRWIRRMELSR